MTAQHYGLPDNVRRAVEVKMGVCEDGHIHISLLDSKGKPFADACIGGVAESTDFHKAFTKALHDIGVTATKGMQ